ncbi:5'-nucleotidase C-terminal domain-containing protein [Brachybacterium sp. UMB0905]|uniref:5'-nucleotidase C-terminal domain-containing protein n=1 Tax=Brachybacterium sp. UMB0905 TaxID=2069310 RepID=UPI000C7FE119|nr:5'-nucleotidase C-terminal domain-containing protein [Brachybacterium sp. UMB0905]PMC76956.1 bifunctional metallophosphatase/5'-nucleotidase [Brachybacterium sp. UMB0905]
MTDAFAHRIARGTTVGLGAAAVAFSTLVVPLGPAAAADAGDQINLIGFNDFHGALGAADAFACSVVTEQAEHDRSLLLSMGDNVGGSAFPSAIQNDEPTIDFLNALGVDAAAIGNHEYDQGQQDLLERIAPRTDFPDLAANVYKADGTRLHDAYTVIEADGVKVAVIGAVTTKTVSKVSPAAIEGLEFRDPVDSVNAALEELKASGEEFDVVVAAYHEGASVDAKDGEAPANTDPIFDKIVTETSGEIDAIFNGDSHRRYIYQAPVPGQDGEERPIIQTGASGENIASVTLELGDDGDWDVVKDSMKMIPTEGADLDACAGNPVYDAAAGVAEQALADAEEIGAEPVGSITDDVTTSWADSKAEYKDGVRVPSKPVNDQATTKGDNRGRHSAAGNMLADSMKWYLEERGTNAGEEIIGWMNPGGIRAELWYDQAADEGDGVITYAEANNMVPFGNTLNSGKVTGAQFIQMLEEQWAADGARFLAFSVSENIEYTFDSTRERGERILDVRVNGEPIDPDATYTIVAASFLFEGGDGMETLAQATDIADTGVLDRDAFVEYLAANEGMDPDYSQRQLDMQLEAGPSSTLTISGLESQSLGAPELTEATVDLGELGTFTAPVEKDAESGRLSAAVELTDVCLEEGETATAVITAAPDTGTSVTAQITGSADASCELVFSDVNVGDMFYDEIMWMAESGYSTGWKEDDGTSTFRPLEPVNRDAMVAFLYRMAGSPEVSYPRSEPFRDVKRGDEHYDAIIWAYQQGVARGWSDRTFRPTEPIARDAMAAFVYRYAGSPDVPELTEDPFSDVSKDSKFAAEIAWMKSEGITTGWPDGSYRPRASTKRDATAAFLYRMNEEQGITYLSEAD